jgi:hypothetical protein
MDFKVGDKVKFLNSRGGGVITKLLDSRMVSVAVEGGFEIPTLKSELIRMEVNEPAARFFTDRSDVRVELNNPEPEKDIELSDDRQGSLPSPVVKNRKSEDIYLAFFPHQQKWLISGLLDIILINNSSFDILYNIYLQDQEGNYKGRDYGSCFPDSKVVIDTINREQIPDWVSGYIQFLFHSSSQHEVLPPFNSQFRISGQKFYNEASYRESPFTEGKIILVKVVSITESMKFVKSKEGKGSTRSISSGNDVFITKHMVNQREAVVDLHIHELIEDPGSMENQEILDFQKNYFERCLEDAIANHYRKVTFIHGVGNGVLRENILSILEKYEGIEVLDAPMEKYGVGAVEVRIPHNF